MRPLLMSAPMAVASLADIKTVTRRLTGLEEINEAPHVWKLDDFVQVNGPGTTSYLQARFTSPGRHARYVICPYGVPGDGLWIRENYRYEARYDNLAPSIVPSDTRVWFEADGEKADWAGKLRPCIFMPRWISRLDLEQGNIHVERLVDITEREAQREGVQKAYGVRGINTVLNRREEPGTYHAGFWQLWDKINPGMLFERNPWVWVVNFKRIKQ